VELLLLPAAGKMQWFTWRQRHHHFWLLSVEPVN